MAPLNPSLITPGLDPATAATLAALAKIITVGGGGTSLTIQIGAAKIEISAGDMTLTHGGATIKLSGATVNINSGALEVT